MFRTIATAGAVAAVIVGAGTTALAVSGDSQTTAGHAATSSAKTDPAKHTKGKHGKQRVLRKALLRATHAEVVTKGKDGFIEHDAIRGQVVAVSPTSISVKAADGYGKTFVVGTSTHVRKRVTSAGKAKGTPAKITDVRAGDQVVVLGKQTASSAANPTATVVIDGVPKQK